ncbi:MAG: hypothetical protein CG441_228 [Methylococcaceae bacterium NSM2-1]|nr:MAG: hypothetical protein CG441_228 [Methylococcaceae bacterium NSM2-1]
MFQKLYDKALLWSKHRHAAKYLCIKFCRVLVFSCATGRDAGAHSLGTA